MDIKRLLRHLNAAPKDAKNQYAFMGALACTGVIALAWVVTLPDNWSTSADVAAENERQAGSFSRFFEDAKANLAQVWGSDVADVASTTETTDIPSNSRTGTTVADQPGVSVPTLSTSSVERANATRDSASRPAARTVMIATTSSAQSATSSEE